MGLLNLCCATSDGREAHHQVARPTPPTGPRRTQHSSSVAARTSDRPRMGNPAKKGNISRPVNIGNSLDLRPSGGESVELQTLNTPSQQSQSQYVPAQDRAGQRPTPAPGLAASSPTISGSKSQGRPEETPPLDSGLQEVTPLTRSKGKKPAGLSTGSEGRDDQCVEGLGEAQWSGDRPVTYISTVEQEGIAARPLNIDEVTQRYRSPGPSSGTPSTGGRPSGHRRQRAQTNIAAPETSNVSAQPFPPVFPEAPVPTTDPARHGSPARYRMGPDDTRARAYHDERHLRALETSAAVGSQTSGAGARPGAATANTSTTASTDSGAPGGSWRPRAVRP